MTGNRKYQYLVEGETEKKLLTELKKEGGFILSGAVNHFNVVEHRLTNAMVANISSNTVVILVFDTDKKKTDILKENISKLKKSRNVKDIWCVMQVENLEDELIRSTDVRRIRDLLGCRSDSDFKRDLIKEKRLIAKLREHHFEIDKMWVTSPGIEYRDFQSAGEKIKTVHN